MEIVKSFQCLEITVTVNFTKNEHFKTFFLLKKNFADN